MFKIYIVYILRCIDGILKLKIISPSLPLHFLPISEKGGWGRERFPFIRLPSPPKRESTHAITNFSPPNPSLTPPLLSIQTEWKGWRDIYLPIPMLLVGT